ncbi:MAG: pilus assembly PilX family protein [Minisyncoccota bacterium]
MAIKITYQNKSHEEESRRPESRGFALLIAIIFMSVMLTFGLALGSLAYKQQTLASAAVESQYAFYAADAALECALYYDQQDGGQPSLFAYPTPDPGVAPVMRCDGVTAISPTETWNGTRWIVTSRLLIDGGTSHPRCADVTVYKYKLPQAGGETTYIFSQGYDVSCANVGTGRSASRGLKASY